MGDVSRKDCSTFTHRQDPHPAHRLDAVLPHYLCSSVVVVGAVVRDGVRQRAEVAVAMLAPDASERPDRPGVYSAGSAKPDQFGAASMPICPRWPVRPGPPAKWYGVLSRRPVSRWRKWHPRHRRPSYVATLDRHCSASQEDLTVAVVIANQTSS